MTEPGQPRHPINAQMLAGICQVVRMFSVCQIHLYVSIGTLESDLLSQSIPCGTKWYLSSYNSTDIFSKKKKRMENFILDLI